jgi:hypothetical protein
MSFYAHGCALPHHILITQPLSVRVRVLVRVRCRCHTLITHVYVFVCALLRRLLSDHATPHYACVRVHVHCLATLAGPCGR